MTDRWVAFLRAINVANRRVTGDRLVTIFESLGFENVSSFQAGGNVLFSAETPDRDEVEQALESELGYEVPTVVRPERALRSTASATPFDAVELGATDQRIQVILLRDPVPREKLSTACSFAAEEDLLRPHGDDLFWLPRTGISRSTLDLDALGRELGPVTVRTHATIKRLAERL